MSTINDVQSAMVDVISPIIYPNGILQPSILGYRVSTITVTSGGMGYTSAVISFSGGNGFNATAEPTIIGGIITSITVIEPRYNFGYTSTPMVIITGDGTGATATANLTTVKIYLAQGDFLKRNIDDGLLAGDAFVSVFAINGMTRNTTRFKRFQVDAFIETATLTITIFEDTATISGTVTVGEAAMVIVNGVGYSYEALTGDTLDDIATNLAALIPTATVLGSVITIPGEFNLLGRVIVSGTATTILHTQESVFRARVFSNINEKREIIGSAIQTGFGIFGYYLTMPDGVAASIKPKGIMEVNTGEWANAFVRDYQYLVEYHTTQVSTFRTIGVVELTQNISITPI